jgi:hypothetical protein
MTKVCFQGDELHFRLVGVWLFKLGMLFEIERACMLCVAMNLLWIVNILLYVQ